MKADWKDSLVLIVSKDRNNSRFGTGFVIHHDASGTCILTCAHVIRDVGGKDQVRSGGRDVQVIADGEGRGIDLAVLRTDAYGDRPEIALCLSGEKDRAFLTAGFQLFDKKYLLRELDGHLGKSGGFEIPETAFRIPVWDLLIIDDYSLQPGYSGSPVIDSESGYAMAVVSHRQGQGERGIAVSVQALESIWEDIPPDLIRKAGDSGLAEKREADQRKKNARPREAWSLCNRLKEDMEFRDFFHSKCGECPGQPHFYVIPGEEGECHSTLVRRLKDRQIKEFIRKNRKETRSPHMLRVPWEICGEDPLIRQKILCGHIAEELGLDSRDAPDRFSDLVQKLNLREYPLVMLIHDIRAGTWQKPDARLLEWYIREYWQTAECGPDMPLFLVFFCLIFRTREQEGFWKSRYLRWHNRRILAEIRRITANAEQEKPCLVFEELRSPDRDDLSHWFSRYAYDMEEKEKLDMIAALFGRRERIRMAEAEKLLREISGQINRRLSGLHSRGG